MRFEARVKTFATTLAVAVAAAMERGKTAMSGRGDADVTFVKEVARSNMVEIEAAKLGEDKVERTCPPLASMIETHHKQLLDHLEDFNKNRGAKIDFPKLTDEDRR